MSNTIRTFIAAPLNLKIIQAIEHIQDHLKNLDCNVKWVKPENIHLTLKFLGDVNTKKIAALTQTLADLCQKIKPIETELTQLGTFPNIKSPRIVWVGLRDDKQNIVQLVKYLEKTLGKIGFKKDQRSFSPHITIGRIRTPKNINALSQAISDYSLPAGLTQTIANVTLYKSILTPHYPIYDKLANFDLH